MVDDLLKTTPIFASGFNKVFPLSFQKETADCSFLKLKKEWQQTKLKPSVNLQELLDEKPGKKYFETNRNFGPLVPTTYHRTEAPRISTKGSTFHGMKKNLEIEILNQLTLKRNAVFVDIDMGAAHTRVARRLLSRSDSQLDKSLKDPEFWNTQIKLAKPFFEERRVTLQDKEIKKILKVALYTSMNGGNPTSDARLLKNLSDNAGRYIDEQGLSNVIDIRESELYKAAGKCLSEFQLVKEVRELNTSCTHRIGKDEFESYTIDRTSSYKYKQAHLGISRVLQGFEVVLLTVLVREVLKAGGIPVSLDHDGVLAMFSKKKFDSYKRDCKYLCAVVAEGDFKDWSSFLLDEPMPIEPKRLWIDGQLTEF